MLYSFENGKVLTQGLEYSVSYHCNLRCAGCSHLSPFSQKKFPSLDNFCADIKKLSEGLHTSDFRLMGGEPLLNPEINEFIKETRKSGITDSVGVTTNGLLLHTMNDDFWENVDLIRISIYPDNHPQEKFINIFKEHAAEFNTKLLIFSKSRFRTALVTEPHPRDWITDMIFKTCGATHLGHCHMIHEGKLYKCPASPFLPEYLGKMGRESYNPANDAFDIHNSLDIFHDLKDFLTSPQSLEACRFCLGNVGIRGKHHQLEMEYLQHPELQNIRRSTHLNTTLFLGHCGYYYCRRFLEKLTGKQFW